MMIANICVYDHNFGLAFSLENDPPKLSKRGREIDPSGSSMFAL